MSLFISSSLNSSLNFFESFNIPLVASGNASKVLEVVEKKLADNSFASLQIPLDGVLGSRVSILQTSLDPSRIQSCVAEGRVLQEKQLELIQKALPEISSHRISSFISTVEGFYSEALLEGKSPKEALNYALGKGLVRVLVELPSTDEIAESETLQKKIKADSELKFYNRVITGNLEEESLPVDRVARNIAESKLLDFIYPELRAESVASPEVEVFFSKDVLLLLKVAYPMVEEEYERISSDLQGSCILVKGVEASAKDILDRLSSLLEGVDFEGKEVAAACLPVIEDFLAQAESKLTAENLGEVREEFGLKSKSLITYFHKVEQTIISAPSKEKALKLGVEAIREGDSLEGVMGLFVGFVGSITEEDEIRAAFPGCLLGEAEWTTHLGAVEKIPLPTQMLSILSGPCPITPNKKVGETHILVLIPEKVNGQPLTLNSLGSLVKSKGHFPGTEAGYAYMYDAIATKHGNKPAGGSHYVLMTKDVLPGSRSKSYEDQQAMVTTLAASSGAAYEVPSVLPVTAGVLVNYLASGVRLFSNEPWTYTRCQEKIGGYSVVVGGFAAAGLKVHSSHAYGLDNFGVGVLRKF